jgi:conserved oligomeric Golgi complex subunit 2
MVRTMIRYTTWLSSGVSARKASDWSSNSPADAEWALSVPVEDFIYVSGIYNHI